MELTTTVKPFSYHGVNFTKQKNDELIANCIFCDKEDHFHANKDSGQWICFKCKRTGNVLTFLQQIYEHALATTTTEHLQQLANKRGLPLLAIKRWDVAFNGKNYLIPIYSGEGSICNIGVYKFGLGVWPTEGIPTFLYGIKQLKKITTATPIYFCEGPWDCMALSWLLWRTRNPGICIGVPGSVFKTEWIDYFSDKENLNICTDNDEGGLKLRLIIEGTLNKQTHAITWPDNLPRAYDLNNLVTDVAIKQTAPNRCYDVFKRYVNGTPVQLVPSSRPSLEEIIEGFSQWLNLTPTFIDGIKLTLATILSAKLPGSDPVWLLLVGPPSSGKSKTIESARLCSTVYYQSTLRKQALMSGFQAKKGLADPSLIPKLNNKCLLLKDLTEVLNKHPGERDEIFSTLRGSFDGETDLDYGNFVGRRYVSKFAVVAAVTREIYSYDTSALGERFLRFNIVREQFDEDEQQEKALHTGLFGDEKKVIVQKLVKGFIDYPWKFDPYQVSSYVPQWFRDKIKSLARLVAGLRTTVKRYQFGYMQNEIIYKPQNELGNRLVVQFQRLAICLAIVEDKKEIDESIYTIIAHVGLDCLNEYITDLCKYVSSHPTSDVNVISKAINMSTASVGKYLDDLVVLGLFTKNSQNQYSVGEKLALLWSNV